MCGLSGFVDLRGGSGGKAALARILAEHRRGRRNHAGRLRALMALEAWFQRHAPEWRLQP